MSETRHDPSDLITRLVPILVVPDLAAERAFYEALGLRVTNSVQGASPAVQGGVSPEPGGKLWPRVSAYRRAGGTLKPVERV